jgi:hypothetical protein
MAASASLAALDGARDVVPLRGGLPLGEVLVVFFLAMTVLSEQTGCSIAGESFSGNPDRPEMTENGQENAYDSEVWQRCN